MSHNLGLQLSEEDAIDDCWNRIGVRGDKSCPLLAEYVHCRNCHVYAAAAARLMSRPLPESYQQEWTMQFGLQQAEYIEAAESAIIFRIGDEWLALPTAMLVQVTDVRPIHPIPHRRGGALMGLVNVRGELLICLSLASLLGVSAPTPQADQTTIVRPRLLIVRWEGLQLGFPVEEIQGVERYHLADLRPLPATLAKSNPFCRGIVTFGERGVGCLDPDLLYKSVNRSLT